MALKVTHVTGKPWGDAWGADHIVTGDTSGLGGGFGMDGEDGEDGFPGPAGPAGDDGAAGEVGQPGPPGLDGEDADDVTFPAPPATLLEWYSGILTPLGFITSTASGTIQIGSTECQAWYLGRAPRAITSALARFRVTSAMSGVTWAEMYLAKGTPSIGSSVSLTVVGYVSIASSWTGTGLIDTTITVDANQRIIAGDGVYIGAAKLSTGTPIIRAGTIGDDLQSGLILDGGNVRPSTILGTPTTFPVATNTKAAAWCRVQVF